MDIYTLDAPEEIYNWKFRRWLAVADYSFTLGRLEAGASSTFAQGYNAIAATADLV